MMYFLQCSPLMICHISYKRKGWSVWKNRTWVPARLLGVRSIQGRNILLNWKKVPRSHSVSGLENAMDKETEDFYPFCIKEKTHQETQCAIHVLMKPSPELEEVEASLERKERSQQSHYFRTAISSKQRFTEVGRPLPLEFFWALIELEILDLLLLYVFMKISTSEWRWWVCF